MEIGTGGRQSISEQRKSEALQRLEDAKEEPAVAAALRAFPGARVLEVRPAPVPDVEPAPDEDQSEDDTDNVVEVDFARRR